MKREGKKRHRALERVEEENQKKSTFSAEGDIKRKKIESF